MILAFLISLTTLMPLEPALARKGLLELRSAVEGSSFICIGTVDEVRTVALPPVTSTDRKGGLRTSQDQVSFGRIRVERVLKGDPRTEVVFHEAWSSWKCDTTSSHRGQRAVFFLAPGQYPVMPAEAQAQVLSHLGDAPILRNLGSGDGIVPFRGDVGEETVSFAGAPNSMRLAASDPTLTVAAGRRIRAATFVDYVENLCRFDPANVAVFARALTPVRVGEKPFDLRISWTGKVRLALGGRVEEHVQLFDLEPAQWSALQTGLRELLATGDVTYKGAEPYGVQRLLQVSIDGRRIVFNEAGNLPGIQVPQAQLPSLRSSLRAWSLVRSAIDCAECVDHRALDAVWLER